MSSIAVLALGFFLGMRHATDADHVMAVTTIVSRTRTPRAAVMVGALWGLGHTATILVVGGAIVLFGLVIPPRIGLSMEMSVAAMLVVLGAMNLTGAARRIDEAAHAAQHVAGIPHTHDVRPRVAAFALGRYALEDGLRPLLVGVVHGLAGSAAIALLVLTTIRDAGSALLYLGIFGAGTVLGMMLLTAAMAAPIAAATRRFRSVEPTLARVTGVASIIFGIFLAYQIGVVDGLFAAQPSWNPR